jgi:hypothetical protein
MRFAPAVALLAAAVVLAACGEDGGEGPTMKPGQDCLGCHGNFAAAGTVRNNASGPISGLTVDITMGTGHLTTTTNSVGNFYVSGSGTPSDATINGISMSSRSVTALNGHCNSCHTGGIALH